ncbi:hypothetical protein Smp_142880 [Schistosoma mansoni]|uniref:hypothetical protein n=1 Tax=Schistosoma mansoni TaxID=6183 RepID=UPI0001A63A76|nr:hypothetical protein Smp_142880 [Schistosoma mansoni]|eukprot:XP_018653763.1 hypothetical protein Smp_142880 [Schistosoma mansoni]
MGSTVGSNANLTQDLMNDSNIGESNPSNTTSSLSTSTSNQVAKQRVKVERLEKQLGDNDKKEIELMYAYREAVDIANHRLCELEKSKYEIIANAYQDYVPCSDYRALVELHIQKGTEFIPEKYHFDGFHESNLSNSTAPPINPIDNLETIAIHEANLEREYLSACYPVARCIAAIEKQENGLATHGIYRVPASKAKVSNLMDLLQSNQLVSSEQIQSDIDLLSQEHPLTLASLVKTQLIALPEPLLTYNLYPNFVELGKAFDLVDSNITDELMKRLQLLINHLSPGNRQLAGLIFHHLHRFQVANMMEFMDNKGQTKVVELLIDRVFQVFGSSEQYDPIKLITAHITSNDDKTTIADYNRMNSARGSISLANSLLTGALPLYTPYRQNQGFNKDSANIEETPSNTSSDITVSSLHGADKHDKIHKRYNPVIYDKPTNIKPASPSSSSSIVRGIKKLYSSSGQHSISPSTIASSITTSKLFHSSDKQNISNTSSTDPNTNTALSSLIIGRRKPLGRLLALHQTVENSDDVSPVNPTNLDQYSFIDNDLPDSSNG